jgi:hypothetical protein
MGPIRKDEIGSYDQPSKAEIEARGRLVVHLRRQQRCAMGEIGQQQVVQTSSKAPLLVLGDDGQLGDLEAVVEPVSAFGAVKPCGHRLAPPSAGNACVAVGESGDLSIEGRDTETEIGVSGVTKHSGTKLVDARASGPERRRPPGSPIGLDDAPANGLCVAAPQSSHLHRQNLLFVSFLGEMAP